VAGKPVISKKPCSNFREFLSFVDDKDWMTRNPIPGGVRAQGNRQFDIEDTAQSLRKLQMDQNAYVPWRVYKDGTAFNKMIEDISRTVATTKGSVTADRYDPFKGVEEALGKVAWARHVDHSPHIIQKLKDAISDIQIEASVVGKNYLGKDMLDFKLEDTIKANEAAMPDIRTRIANALNTYYTTDTTARDHRIVMDSFEIAKNRISGISCSI
jgi:hypothetical protein